MAVGKRLSTADPLTEHDVADRIDRAALRLARILADIRQQGGMEAVQHSRYLTNAANILAAELQAWGIEPQAGWIGETAEAGTGSEHREGGRVMAEREAGELAAKIITRAGKVIFSSWGDRALTQRELTGVLQEEITPAPQDRTGAAARPARERPRTYAGPYCDSALAEIPAMRLKGILDLKPGDPVRVMDDYLEAGSPGWTGRVIAVTGDSAEVHYGGGSETFSLPAGRCGWRYLVPERGGA
jgi:hypothetical protein